MEDYQLSWTIWYAIRIEIECYRNMQYVGNMTTPIIHEVGVRKISSNDEVIRLYIFLWQLIIIITA